MSNASAYCHDKHQNVMRVNYEYIMQSPAIRALIRENKSLVKQNRVLLKTLEKLILKKKNVKPESVRVECEDDNDVVFIGEDKASAKFDVKIKIEPGLETSGNVIYELVEEEEEEEEAEEEDEAEEEEEETLQVEDEEEVYEITIRGKKYFTTNEKTGTIYSIDKDGDVGDEVGSFNNGVAQFT